MPPPGDTPDTPPDPPPGEGPGFSDDERDVLNQLWGPPPRREQEHRSRTHGSRSSGSHTGRPHRSARAHSSSHSGGARVATGDRRETGFEQSGGSSSHGSGGRGGGPRGRAAYRRGRHVRLWGTIVGLFVVLVVLVVGDAYYEAVQAARTVQAVPGLFHSAKASLQKGEVPSGDPIGEAGSLVDQARSQLADAPFTLNLVGALPLLGRPVNAVKLGVDALGQTTQAAAIVQDVIPKVLPAPGTTSGSPVFADGTVNVALINSLAPDLQRILDHLRAGQASLQEIPSVPFVPQLAALKSKGLTDSAGAVTLAERALAGAKLLPSFMGADGPRTYFLVLQNNADQRGTGGAALAYALLKVSKGQMSILQSGGISGIDNVHGGVHVTFPPAVRWYLQEAGVNPRINNGINYSPDFPVVAQTWARQVAKQTGHQVDGVIAIDPEAVHLAMSGQGGFKVSALHQPITGANVVKVVENKQYLLPHDQQVGLPGQLVAGAFGTITNPQDVPKLLKGLAAAADDKRIQIWSANPRQQKYLASLGWDGALSRNPGDYLYLVDEKRVSNKVDYYTSQAAGYTAMIQADGSVRSTYKVTLTNQTPPGLPHTIVGRWTPYALNVAMLNLYLPKAAHLGSVSPGGDVVTVPNVRPPGFRQHVEDGHRVFTQTINSSPGKPGVLVYRYTTPNVIRQTSLGKVYELTVQHQPLTQPATLALTVVLPPGATLKSAPGWKVNGQVLTMNVVLTHDFTTRIVF